MDRLGAKRISHQWRYHPCSTAERWRYMGEGPGHNRAKYVVYGYSWRDLMHCQKMEAILCLIAVDEAHLLNIWGASWRKYSCR
jgi:hypothetical protein